MAEKWSWADYERLCGSGGEADVGSADAVEVPDRGAVEEVTFAGLDGAALAVLELESGSCKYPSGDPRDADFSFCGRAVSADGPYCEEHARVAFEPVARRRKRTKRAA